MQRHLIGDGRVSLSVSQLCLGTMHFDYRTDERTSWAILDRFVEAGGNFLDTANNYGQWHGDAGASERVIGRWLRSRGMAGQVVVATKVGARTTVPGKPSSDHWQGLGGATIRTDAETSLRQLGVDRLDLYYAHIDDRSTPLEETVGAFAELPQAARSACWAPATTPPGGSSGRAPSREPADWRPTAWCSSGTPICWHNPDRASGTWSLRS